MKFYRSIVAYDGTEFHGFQRQVEGLRTVQEELEKALRILGWSESSLKSAGRTDAGVHANGQVISFGFEWQADQEELSSALNANLPKDIAVRHTETVSEDFHPRFSAQRRYYQYSIYCAPERAPLKDRYTWRIWPEPDFGSLKEIGSRILGRRDFAAFGQAPIEGGHTIREVFRADWSSSSEGLTFDIEANAFLYHMVRRLVAAMMSVGKGKSTSRDIQDLLEDPSKRWEGSIAPANGLSLEAVYYQNR